jgi:hypothetical protein
MKPIPRALAAAIAALALPLAYAQNTPPAAATNQPAAATNQPTAATNQPAPDLNAATSDTSAATLQVNSDVPVPQPPANLVEEPVASAFRTDNGPEAERVKPIVDALNADTSLKASKISVVPEKDLITLVGVTVSEAQRKRAIEIAGSLAGDAKIASALTTQQLVLNTPAAASPAS